MFYGKKPNIRNIPRFSKVAKRAKGYSLCKIVNLGLNFKVQKCTKNHPTGTLETFYSTSSSKKKTLIFEKYQDFEKWWEGKLCKGHDLCKIVNLGLNFKEKSGAKKCQVFEKYQDFEKWP